MTASAWPSCSARRACAPAADGEDADLVVLNTCHIREKAAEKAYSDVGRLRREDGSKPMVALAGCVAQAEGAEAKTRSKMIDLVVGPQAYHRLPEMVAEAAAGSARSTPTCRRSPSSTRFPPAARSGRAPSSPCRKAATNSAPIASCPTPAAPRSAGRSADIVAEARSLVDGGAREITLLGQNVNAWIGEDEGRAGGLDGLIRALAKHRWAGADPLHHQPSGRHDRRADRRPWRGRQADALSPPAGAVGLATASSRR